MTTHPSQALRTAILDLVVIAGLSATMLACSKHVLIDPTFGAGCRVGTLLPGRSVEGALNEDSCIDAHGLRRDTQTAYESHDLDFKKGTAYQLVMTHRLDRRRVGAEEGGRTRWSERNPSHPDAPVAVMHRLTDTQSARFRPGSPGWSFYCHPRDSSSKRPAHQPVEATHRALRAARW